MKVEITFLEKNFNDISNGLNLKDNGEQEITRVFEIDPTKESLEFLTKSEKIKSWNLIDKSDVQEEKTGRELNIDKAGKLSLSEIKSLSFTYYLLYIDGKNEGFERGGIDFENKFFKYHTSREAFNQEKDPLPLELVQTMLTKISTINDGNIMSDWKMRMDKSALLEDSNTSFLQFLKGAYE